MLFTVIKRFKNSPATAAVVLQHEQGNLETMYKNPHV